MYLKQNKTAIYRLTVINRLKPLSSIFYFDWLSLWQKIQITSTFAFILATVHGAHLPITSAAPVKRVVNLSFVSKNNTSARHVTVFINTQRRKHYLRSHEGSEILRVRRNFSSQELQDTRETLMTTDIMTTLSKRHFRNALRLASPAPRPQPLHPPPPQSDRSSGNTAI